MQLWDVLFPRLHVHVITGGLAALQLSMRAHLSDASLCAIDASRCLRHAVKCQEVYPVPLKNPSLMMAHTLYALHCCGQASQYAVVVLGLWSRAAFLILFLSPYAVGFFLTGFIIVPVS